MQRGEAGNLLGSSGKSVRAPMWIPSTDVMSTGNFLMTPPQVGLTWWWSHPGQVGEKCQSFSRSHGYPGPPQCHPCVDHQAGRLIDPPGQSVHDDARTPPATRNRGTGSNSLGQDKVVNPIRSMIFFASDNCTVGFPTLAFNKYMVDGAGNPLLLVRLVLNISTL